MKAIDCQLLMLSRVVIHPAYRGAGIATRFVNRSCQLAPRPWIEAQAQMGWINPFFEKAGFVRVGHAEAKDRSRTAHSGVYGGGRRQHGKETLVSKETHEKSRFSEPVYYIFDNREKYNQAKTPSRKKSESRTTSQLLSEDQRELFLSWLAKGASPTMVCQKLFLSMSDVAETLNQDDEFRRRWQEIDETLSQNVVSALYQSAMKGSVTAQTFWLKHHPPPGWCGNSNKQDDNEKQNFEDLSDEELLELAGTLGLDPPPEFESRTEPSSDEEKSNGISSDDSNRE
jgi:hypothetical protein